MFFVKVRIDVDRVEELGHDVLEITPVITPAEAMQDLLAAG